MFTVTVALFWPVKLRVLKTARIAPSSYVLSVSLTICGEVQPQLECTPEMCTSSS